MFIGGLLFCQALLTVQTWFMGYWAEQYDIYPPEQVNITLWVISFHPIGDFHHSLVDDYWSFVC